jgi:hypothetical protein
MSYLNKLVAVWMNDADVTYFRKLGDEIEDYNYTPPS